MRPRDCSWREINLLAEAGFSELLKKGGLVMIRLYLCPVFSENSLNDVWNTFIRPAQGLARKFFPASSAEGWWISMASMGQPDFWAIISARTPQPVPTSSIAPAPAGSAHEPSSMLSVPTFMVEFESSTLKYLNLNDISEVNID
jgi:hypothetical protein